MLYVTGIIALIVMISRIVHWAQRRDRSDSGRMAPRQDGMPGLDAIEFLRSQEAKRAAKPDTWEAPGARYNIAWDGYIIRKAGLGEGYQLLDAAEHLVFDEFFEDVRYDIGSRMFICRHGSGARIFSAVTGQHWNSPFQGVFIDEWANYTYRNEDDRYGVLDENFQPAFDESFGSLQGIARGYFKVRDSDRQRIVSASGTTLLDHLSRIDEAVIDGRVLVVRNNGHHALFTLQTGALQELDYHHVFVLLSRSSSNPQKDPRYYLASSQLEDLVPGTSVNIRKRTVLNAAGTPIFDPGFDDLSAICLDGRYYFIAGNGDFQLLDHLTEEATGPGDILPGTMRYALYSEDGNMLIPAEYTVMEHPYLDNQLIVTQGGEPQVEEWQDEYIGEDHLSWEMRGGRSGVLDFAGNVVIPLEWAHLEAEYSADPLRSRMYIARRTPDGDAVYFDTNGIRIPDSAPHVRDRSGYPFLRG